MNRTEEREAIEQLAQLLDGELSADEANAPVRALATLASTVQDTETVERPTPAFRAALRNQLVADIEATPVGVVDRVRDAVWDRTARWRNSARIGMATAVASGMLGSAGVAAAAQHALPGEALYGVKRTTESLRLALAGSPAEEARVHLALAEERLEEIRDGLGTLGTDPVVDTLDDMDHSSVEGADLVIEAIAGGADPALFDELMAFTTRQRTGLVDIYDQLPIEARPFADSSLELLRRIDIRVTESREICDCGAAAAGGSGVTPADGTAGDAGPRPGAPCDCVPGETPPPARDPGLAPASDELVPRLGGDDRTDAPSSGGSDSGLNTDVEVPPLPEPLDQVGDAVDEAVDGVQDVVDDLVELAPSPSASTSPLPEVTSSPLDPVDDVVDGATTDVPLPEPSDVTSLLDGA